MSLTIITPNNRLAASLHKAHREKQLQSEASIWQTPDILPITAWLQRLWQTCTERNFAAHPLLLETSHIQFLWEKIIAQTPQSNALLQISETAEMASKAYALAKQWSVDLNHPTFESTEDYHAFKTWAQAYEKLCMQAHYLDSNCLLDILKQKISEDPSLLPTQLQLVGFSDYTPQLTQFLTHCEKIGCQVIKVNSNQNTSATMTCIPFIDPETELLNLARWAKHKYQHTTENIACVIPDLANRRDRVLQIFSEVFADEEHLEIADSSALFNISAGKKFISYPIIYAALQFLQLNQTQLHSDTLNYILLTPFLGESTIEQLARARLDALFRESNIHCYQFHEEEDLFTNCCPLLANRLQNFFARLKHTPPKQSYEKWAQLFKQLLTDLGWPGERSINSEEYQVISGWLQLTDKLSLLDQITEPVSLHTALQTLLKSTAHAIFQAQSPETRIQILGILEAAGLEFDTLWITGMDDMTWPSQPKPNPFIPKSLQRDLQMPHATPERELLFCQQILMQFQFSAKNIIYSYPKKNGDLTLQLTPLLRHLNQQSVEDLELSAYQSISERIHLHQQLEYIQDEKAPAISSQEKIRGGANIIKQQALCPFKSFAEWRLHARELEKIVLGLRARDRGQLVHKILELFWNDIQTQQKLLMLNESELDKHLYHCIDQALDLSPNSHQHLPKYLSLERKRLYKLILQWLEVEKTRPPFKVLKHEQAIQLSVKQLQLRLRIDRIDELIDGKTLIIDYKTGKNNEIHTWFGERPEAPQLPLYALSSSNHIGISFAQIAPGEYGFKGVSQHDLAIKGIRVVTDVSKAMALSWEEQCQQWQQTFEQLSQDFYDGHAQVNPKSLVQTCQFCALKPLCRIHDHLSDTHDTAN